MARPKQRHNSEVSDGNSGITAIISDVFPQYRGAVKARATIPLRRRVFAEGEQQSGLQDALLYHN
jgi:hypothetical protein